MIITTMGISTQNSNNINIAIIVGTTTNNNNIDEQCRKIRWWWKFQRR